MDVVETSIGSVAPVDLEMRVTVEPARDDGLALRYVLNSPNGVVPDCFHLDAGLQPIGSATDFSSQINEVFSQLESLSKGCDTEGRGLLGAEIEKALEALGHQLYQLLFPDLLCAAYVEFRQHVKTWLIVSDDRWSIPWELIRPFSATFADDPLGLRFQLSRWLGGRAEPSKEILVSRAVCLGTGTQPVLAESPKAKEEHQKLREIWASEPDTEVNSFPDLTFDELNDLLKKNELGLIHFTGHGDYADKQPEESSIALTDQTFRARDLTGPLQLIIRTIRPLVFLNACRVTRQTWWLSGLREWAQAWIQGCGCGAFIGPQWAVQDRSALRFAEIFYTELKQGKTLGAALTRARTIFKEEFPGNPAWAAYVGYFHPNTRLIWGPGSAGIRRPSPGLPAEIRARIIDFSRFITEKTEGFVGREWLLDRVARFQRERPRGYFFFSGDPGIGKSSLAAEIVRRYGCVHHFNIRAEGINRAEDFLTNICAQLVATFKLPHTYLPPEAAKNGSFFEGLLEEITHRHPEEKILIVVDALDESVPIRESGNNPLYLPLTLPEGVYIIATSRRGTSINAQVEIEQLDLDQDDEGNLADVRLLVKAWGSREGINTYINDQELEKREFIDQMVGKSQGNFMYLRYMLSEIEDGVYQTQDFETLPTGLMGYYQDHWRRMQSRNETKWFDYQLPILLALTVVKEPVSLDLLAGFSGVSDRRRIRQVLAEWDAFLFQQSFKDEETGKPQKRYRIYSDSFHDFIAAKEEVVGERVDLTTAHGKIADFLWKELYG